MNSHHSSDQGRRANARTAKRSLFLPCLIVLLWSLIPAAWGDPTPELLHYKFSGTGTSVPNLASSPPANTATATIVGGLTQDGPDLNSAGTGHSLVGSGAASTTDFLNTGWATELSGTSWTISFVTSNIGPSATLYYIFGDLGAGSFRCFTNGVAGPNNWILRGTGITDVLANGAAVVATHRTTFVYDQALANIKAYIDGVLVSTVAQGATPVISGAGPFKVMGYSSNVGSPAGGLVDDFRVYNRALSEAEVMGIDSDSTPPDASVPPLLTVEAGPTGRAMLGDLTGNVTASDNSGGTPTVTQTPPADTVYRVGSYPVSFKVEDDSSNFVVVNSTVKIAFPSVTDPTLTANAFEAGPLIKGTPSGDPVPGAGVGGVPADATFAVFSTPAISDTRQLATRATFLTAKKMRGGIYVEDGAGAGSLVAFQNGPALDAAGSPLANVTFKSFRDPLTAPGEAIAFSAKLQGSGAAAGDDGVWSDVFGTPLEMRLLLRENSPVPAIGLKLKAVSSLSLVDGQVLALIQLKSEFGFVTAANDSALLCMTGPSTATVLLREGSGLSGFPGSKIKSFSVLSPALGSPGNGRWHSAAAIVAKVTLTTKEVLIVGISPAGVVAPLLSTADVATPVDPQAHWKSFGLPAISPAGSPVAVGATLQLQNGVVTTSDDSILLTSPDGLNWDVLARENAPISLVINAPHFASFFDPVVNADGQAAFLATLKGTGVKATNKTAIFVGDTSSLSVAARLGDPAPDDSGVATGAVWTKFPSIALPAGTGIVFLAETKGGDTTAKNKTGLWAANSKGDLRRVLRTGTSLVVGGPTITKLTLLNAVQGAFGVTRSFNSTNSLVVLAKFSDKSQSLIRVDLP